MSLSGFILAYTLTNCVLRMMQLVASRTCDRLNNERFFIVDPFLARDVIHTSRAYAMMSVSVCL